MWFLFYREMCLELDENSSISIFSPSFAVHFLQLQHREPSRLDFVEETNAK
jgi:hypothetical protein